MTLAAGRRLGPYEIVAPLGAGGMGEVYRAKDTRLGREVAVKVLAQHLSSEPGLRSRFEREARTVSGLNHPHICTLHDVGREGDTDFLVMELVEGETLAHRLARGPLPTSEVLRIGIQIADALDRAHRAGVIHRDLKPGNVMLARSGAKLMDFGLARPAGVDGPVSSIAMTQSPTMAPPLTAHGTLVGTFQYMAPEQLEGQEADARTDLWALGCVLYEMATGKPAFQGKSRASLISAVMSAEPAPMATMAPLSPPALERLVRACLAKDADERLQTAHDVRLQLQWIAEGISSTTGQAIVPVRRRFASPLAIVIGALALLAAGLVGFLLRTQATQTPKRVSILAPESATFEDSDISVAISPDGMAIVFVAKDSAGSSQLWVRKLDVAEARSLPATANAELPFWSPDSRFVGFFADGKLRKVDVDGRSVQVLCDAPDGRGGTWNRRGTILFAPSSSGGLSRVSDGGGTATPVLAPDSTRKETSLRFPCFLPDGEHFLYVALATIDSLPVRMGSLRDGHTRWVMNGAGAAVYAAPGHLLYGREGALIFQPFDVGRGRLTGEPRVVGVDVHATNISGAPPASVSANGVLAQRFRTRLTNGFVWLDREGHRVGSVPTAPATYVDPVLSPDDRSIAAWRISTDSQDIWTIDVSSGQASRLTLDQRLCEQPVWSPDGRWIAYSAVEGQNRNIYRKLATGGGEPEELFGSRTGFVNPLSWSRGGMLVYRELDAATGENVWALPLNGEKRSTPVLRSRYHEEDARVSPDGRWLAYRSNESGRSELYVQSFPVAGFKTKVSIDGAGTGPRAALGDPMWRNDGKEIAYIGGDGVSVISVPVEASPTSIRFGSPRRLFRLPEGSFALTATSDLSRFLQLEFRRTKETSSVQLLMDWPAEIAKR